MRSRLDGTCIREQCVERKLGVTMVTRDHVTVAVSCCLVMALWRSLWKADQVSVMASGGLSASRMRLLMKFLACGPGRTMVSSMEGDDVDVWVSVEFALFSSFGHVSWSGAGC